MDSFYTANEYHTPPDVPKGLAARVLPGTAPAFYWYVLRIILWARSLAVNGKFGDAALAEGGLRFARYTEACGGRLHVTGLDSLRTTTTPAVFVANHMSVLETFLLPGMIVPIKPLKFVVKESLVSHPLFGPIMSALDPITVTRTNTRDDLRNVLEQGAEALRSGRSMCIFPQSTRRPVFVQSTFNSLGARLAHRAAAPIIPVALKTDLWGIGKRVKDVGRVDTSKEVRFAFGEVIRPTQHPKTAHEQVLEFLKQHLPAWGVPWSD